MKEALTKIMTLKVNMLACVAIAVLASLVTSFTSQLLVSKPASDQVIAAQVPMAPAGPVSVLNCPEGVYSPVQRTCVSQETFDAEMQRLFAALGINTSAYDLSNANSKTEEADTERN